MRQKKWTELQLIDAVKASESLAQVLKKLGLYSEGSGNYHTIRDYIKKLNINTKHWLGQGIWKGKERPLIQQKNVEVYLKLHEIHPNRSSIKKILIREGVLVQECAICGLGTTWKRKKLVLVFDHINGNGLDYRRENLRLLCPNCNSQTKTFAGRNKGKIHKSC